MHTDMPRSEQTRSEPDSPDRCLGALYNLCFISVDLVNRINAFSDVRSVLVTFSFIRLQQNLCISLIMICSASYVHQRML